MGQGFWYKFASRPARLFYVSESKALARREERAGGEAIGKPLVLTFFEEMGPGVVRWVDRSGALMRPWLFTAAELLSAVGVWLPPDPERSSRDAEAQLEDLFVEHGFRRLQGQVEPGASEVHVYTLHDEVDSEIAFFAEAQPNALTKIALARCLELHGGEHLGGRHGSRRTWRPCARAPSLSCNPSGRRRPRTRTSPRLAKLWAGGAKARRRRAPAPQARARPTVETQPRDGPAGSSGNAAQGGA